MRLMLVGALVALAAATIPQRLLAQGRAAMIAPSPEALMATAALHSTPSRSFTATRPSLVADVDNARGSRRRGEVLMIVGGAVLVTGLLVDESLVTIAGIAVGGYGLYLYLRDTR